MTSDCPALIGSLQCKTPPKWGQTCTWRGGPKGQPLDFYHARAGLVEFTWNTTPAMRTTIGILSKIRLYVARRIPLWSFIATLFVLITANDRLELGRFAVEGPAIRGFLRLSDLLWLMSVVGVVLLRPWVYLQPTLPVSVRATLPFAFLSVMLPLLGVLVGRGPVSYATVGFRYLQAASFALLAYLLCRRYGSEAVSRSLLNALFVAIVCHGVYAMIQVGYSLKWLSKAWVLPDVIFAEQHAKSWFFYPRTTGLHVNPNALGTTAVAIGLSVWSAYVTSYKLAPVARIVLPLIVIFAVLSSGSRTALLGVVVGLGTLLATQLSPRGQYAKRSLHAALSLGALGTASIVAAGLIMPDRLLDRYARFADLLSVGAAADANFIGRFRRWEYFWQLYINDYPLGTWVPPSYIANDAVDSLYVQTAVQGTPVFTLMFILFLAGAFWTGREALNRARTPSSAAASLSLMGWSALMAVTSVSTSQVLLFPLIWSGVGICLAIAEGSSMFQDQVDPPLASRG